MGPEHPNVATSLNNLAEFYRAQGRYADAEPLHKRALSIAYRDFVRFPQVRATDSTNEPLTIAQL